MKKRVLIADDSKSWLLFNAEIIHQLYMDNVEIILVKSAKEALDIINENINNPFDVILTDLQMETDYEPLCAGEWLIEKIKGIEKYSHTPIIIISAMGSIKYIAKKYSVEFISKNQLINNKLLLKLMLDKLVPSLSNIEK